MPMSQLPPRPISRPDRDLLVFVTSIILAAFGLFGLWAMYQVSNGGSAEQVGLTPELFAFSVAGAAYQLVVGALGVANAAKPERSLLLIVLGFGLIAMHAGSLVLSFMDQVDSGTSFWGFLLPIAFVAGAFSLKRQRDWQQKQAAGQGR